MPLGSPYPQDVPLLATGAGFKTPFGIAILPPASRVAAFVRSTGLQSGDDPFTAANLVTTLAAGLARVRAGLSDTVIVLPGHTESVTDATMLTSLAAGTRILGFGRGSAMPTFRWTATASQWALTASDVVVQGLRLRLEGANGVVKAINVTGSDVAFYGNDIEVASGAALKATIALEVGIGANRFELVGNIFRGTATHNVTNGVLVAAAVDQVRIEDNEMIFSATAANGCVNITAAATALKVLRNYIYNTHTTSTAGITMANVVVDGICAENAIGVTATGAQTSNTTGINTGAAVTVKFFDNLICNDGRSSGLLQPTVDT
jgi:hypothetical protein